MTETNTIKVYVPKAAAETTYHGDVTMMEKLKKRVSTKFGGFTEYQASGGWVNDKGELIEENVFVLEVTTRERERKCEVFAKANASWLARNTNEDTVMVMVNNERYFINN